MTSCKVFLSLINIQCRILKAALAAFFFMKAVIERLRTMLYFAVTSLKLKNIKQIDTQKNVARPTASKNIPKLTIAAKK
jgi:hypothetical protein